MDLAHKIKMEKNKGFVAYLNSIGFNDFTCSCPMNSPSL